MANQPYYEENSWANVHPLKSSAGNERAKTITLAASTFVADSNSRKKVSPGTFVVEITSGHNIGKYGPYLKTASDGRESPAEGGVAFTWEAHELTLNLDRAVAGLYVQCVFDMSELTMGGYSLHSTSLTNLKTYFPQCTFDD